MPVIGAFLMIGVWPLIMGITMWLQMKMNPSPPDPTQAMIFNMMPIFFTFLLASFPAGLVIYWAWNNSLSVLQQYVIMRRHGVQVELWGNISGLFRRGDRKGRDLTAPSDTPANPHRRIRTRRRPRALEAGRLLFAGDWDFTRACHAIDQLPDSGPVEVAFAGRSNVGKSSLLNALIGQKQLARSSNTPGRTRALNLFARTDAVGPVVVDMPGYGYAKAPKAEVAAWTALVFDYLRGRPNLARVYLLIDARHGPKPVDVEAMRVMDEAAISYQIVLTKCRQVRLRSRRRHRRHPGDAAPPSGRTSGGSDDLGGQRRRNRRAARGHRHPGGRARLTHRSIGCSLRWFS